jgi:hypothetical protein
MGRASRRKHTVLMAAAMMRPIACPACHRTSDAVTMTSAEALRVPVPGDAIICGYCHAVQILLEPGRVRLATSEECEELSALAKQIAASKPFLR